MSGTVSFSMPVSNPTLAAYSVLIHYEDGSAPMWLPAEVQAWRDFVDWCNQKGIVLRGTDNDNGIFTANGVRLQFEYEGQPRFKLYEYTSEQRDWYYANRDGKIAVYAYDFNFDGYVDYFIGTEYGFFVLKRLP